MTSIYHLLMCLIFNSMQSDDDWIWCWPIPIKSASRQALSAAKCMVQAPQAERDHAAVMRESRDGSAAPDQLDRAFRDMYRTKSLVAQSTRTCISSPPLHRLGITKVSSHTCTCVTSRTMRPPLFPLSLLVPGSHSGTASDATPSFSLSACCHLTERLRQSFHSLSKAATGFVRRSVLTPLFRNCPLPG